MSPSIRFMGVAARTADRRRRIDLVRNLLRRTDAAAAPRPVPPTPPEPRDTGGRPHPPR